MCDSENQDNRESVTKRIECQAGRGPDEKKGAQKS